jgi:Flp pilus assembly protein TadD
MNSNQHNAAKALILLAVVTVLVYSNSFSNAFTFDDHPLVENNAVAKDGSLAEILTTPFWPSQPELGLYRPITVLTLAANHRLSGPDPVGFRVTNTLLHITTCWLLYLVVARLCGHRPGLAAAVVFAIHPLQSEAVNAIVGRAELLAAGFALLAWVSHDRARSDGSVWRAVSWIAYLLACLSKEHALVLPAFLVAEDVFLNREGATRERLIETFSGWREWAPYVFVGVGALSLRAAVVGSVFLPGSPNYTDNPLAHVDPVSRAFAAVAVFARYAGLVIAPVHLTADYTYNQISVVVAFYNPLFLAGFCLIAALLTIAYRAANNEVNGLIGLGVFVLLIAWLPVSNVLFSIGTPMNERLMYLPMIGFGILVAVGFGRLEEAVPVCPPWLVAAVVCTLFAVRTTIRNADWQDDLSLFRAASRVSPNSAKAFFNLGNALRDAGNDAGALDAYARALAIYPAYAEVHYNRGVLYQDQKRPKLAVSAYRKALDHDPDHVNTLLNQAILLARSGNLDGGLRFLKRAADLAPARSDIHYNLGLLLERGNRSQAVSAYKRALAVAPGYEAAAINLAMLYRGMDRVAEMNAAYAEVLKANPAAYQAAYNLGVEWERSGKTREALDAYRIAVGGGGEMGVFSRLRMGSLFASIGQPDSARVALQAFKVDWKGDERHLQTADRLLNALR